MSNERARESNERGGDANRSTVDEPGGGPRRVVSETSVDDILESLDDGPANEPSDGPTADSTDAPPSGSIDGTGAADESSRIAPARTTDGPADATEPGAADDPGSATGTTAPSSETNEPDEPGDGTELTYEDDDALAGRVATNDVTGADVRAAETDSDRESTPEIDDVDLSLDDLENAQIGDSSTADSDGSSGTDTTRDGDSDEADDQSDDDDTGGVAGLFRRLFPWTR